MNISTGKVLCTLSYRYVVYFALQYVLTVQILPYAHTFPIHMYKERKT